MAAPLRFTSLVLLAALSSASPPHPEPLPRQAGEREAGGDAKVVEISAKRFEFTPSVVTLRKDEPVVLRLRSQDVTHGFYMKALGIDATIEPGKTVDVPVTPHTPGKYVVICDHFCGSGHGNMKLTLVVE